MPEDAKKAPIWPFHFTDPATKGVCCVSLVHHPTSTTSLDASMDFTEEVNGIEQHQCMPDPVNPGTPDDPHLVLRCEDSATNSLPAAYNSNGYPSVTGPPHGAVYNAFADLKCVSISSVELPPSETVIVGKATGPGVSQSFVKVPPPATRAGSVDMDDDFDIDDLHAGAHSPGFTSPNRVNSWMNSGMAGSMGTVAEMETLLHVEWQRAGSVFEGKTKQNKDPTPPNYSAMQTLPQYLKRFPEGIHSIQTSDHLERLVLQGDLPLQEPGILSSHTVCYPPSVHRHLPTPAPKSDSSKPKKDSEAPPAASVPPAHYLLAKPPAGPAPVQHTMLAVNSYTHLTVYFVAHQDGKVLLSAPMQTYSASIATKKVTAQKMLILARHSEHHRGRSELASPSSSASPNIKVPPGASGSSAYVYESSHAVSVPRAVSTTFKNKSSASITGSSTGGGGPVKQAKQSFSFVDLPIDDREQALFCSGGGCCTSGMGFPPGPSSGERRASGCANGSLLECRSASYVAGGTRFRGVDCRRRTISVVPCAFTVAPMMLVGNQSGDILLMDIFEREIVLRLNYKPPTRSSATSREGSSTNAAQGSSSQGSSFSTSHAANGKLINAAVTCIVEVECGVEKYLGSLIQSAASAKRDGISMFDSYRASHKDDQHEAVNPSIYAVGFEDGQMLLICIMSEGGWMLRHFARAFGSHPIEDMVVRRYDFFTRLWVSYGVDPAEEEGSCGLPKPVAGSRAKPGSLSYTQTCTITADSILNIPDRNLAAVACNGGMIYLVQLPEMEVLHSISVLDFNAVGSIQVLRWLPSQREALLAPDLLIAAGEDDTLTSFYLAQTVAGQPSTAAGHASPMPGSPKGSTLIVTPYPTSSAATRARELGSSGVFGSSSFFAAHNHSNTGFAAVNERPQALALRVLEKKVFHRSWVTSLSLMPLTVPLEQSGGGMPQFHGVMLLAASYDGSVSFWPHFFSSAAGGSGGSRPREGSAAPCEGAGTTSGRTHTKPGGEAIPAVQTGTSERRTRSVSAPSAGGGGSDNTNLNATNPLVGSPIVPFIASTTYTSGLKPFDSHGSFSSALNAGGGGGGRVGDGRLMLIHGPSSVFRMHADLVIRTLCSGAGTSFFMTTACCRGKVKCWSITIRDGQS